jgi:hypothetical protein
LFWLFALRAAIGFGSAKGKYSSAAADAVAGPRGFDLVDTRDKEALYESALTDC